MKKVSILIVVFVMLALPILGDQAYAATTPIDFTGFTGVGFAPTPGAGQLDSDIWRVTGLSDGDLAFGGTGTSGDYARGSSTGGVTNGGVYAFNHGSGDVALGIQPSNADFTPGELILKVENTSGSTVSDIYIGYEIWVYNDQGRASSLDLSYELNCTDGNGTYTDVSALDYTTPEAADTTPAWSSITRSTTLSSVSLANGNSICLKWTSDDVSGSGSRDEFGIDDIEVRIDGPTAITLNSLTANSGSGIVVLLVGVIVLTGAGMFVLRRRKNA